jgi:hypothetical protein
LLAGFLALVGQYLMKGPILGQPKKGRLVKDFPLMVRTSMAIIARHAVPDELRRGAGLAALIAAAVTVGDRDSADEAIYGDSSEYELTIEDWLTGLVNGEDLMTAIDPNLGSHDDEQAQEHVGSQDLPAAVIELRRVEEDLPWHEWAAFALNVAAWLDRVNQPKGGYTPYKRGR